MQPLLNTFSSSWKVTSSKAETETTRLPKHHGLVWRIGENCTTSEVGDLHVPPKHPLETLLPAPQSFCWASISKRPPHPFQDLYHRAVNAATKMRPVRALTASPEPQKSGILPPFRERSMLFCTATSVLRAGSPAGDSPGADGG